MTKQIRGSFDVKLAPIAAYDTSAGTPLGRMSIDKRFHGALDAVSVGEMLMAGSATVKGSAGYVALERVSGTLDGHAGSFVLQHSGTMNRGAPTLVVSVVPDSGTDALAGLTGTMAIEITAGKHFYEFTYTISGS